MTRTLLTTLAWIYGPSFAVLVVVVLLDAIRERRRRVPPSDPAIREDQTCASLDAIWELTPDDQQTRERIARLMRDLALVQGVRS